MMNCLAKQNMGPVFTAAGLLLGAILVGAIVVMYFRKKLLTDSHSASSDGFSLDQLHEMKASGQMSEQEYRRARQLIMASMGVAGIAQTSDIDDDAIAAEAADDDGDESDLSTDKPD